MRSSYCPLLCRHEANLPRLLRTGGSRPSHALSHEVGQAVSDVAQPATAADAADEGCRRNNPYLPTDNTALASGEWHENPEAYSLHCSGQP